MYKFHITGPKVTVSMSGDWEDLSRPSVRGDRKWFVRWLAENGRGPFGHKIVIEAIRPADLHFALSWAKEPFEMEGKIKNYSTPEGDEVF